MCGIVAFNGKNPDLNTLKILAMYNDSRGGDGCGYSINGEIKKYAQLSHDSFTKLFTKPEGQEFKIPNPRTNQTILMHTRKASVGGSIERNCHPFLLEKEDSKLIGVHNGTIKNIEDLADKYLSDDEFMDLPVNPTDSLVLFTILNSTRKFEVLTEYEGGAALVWYDPKEPEKIYLFKGASKAQQNYHMHRYYMDMDNSTEEELVEERPLFYAYQLNKKGEKEGIYISSIKEALEAVGLMDIYTVSNNNIFIFNKGVLESSLKIEKTTPYNKPKPEPVETKIVPINNTTLQSHASNIFYPTTKAQEEGLIHFNQYNYYVGNNGKYADGLYKIHKTSQGLYYGELELTWSALVSRYKENPTQFGYTLKFNYSGKEEFAFFYEGVLITNFLEYMALTVIDSNPIIKMIKVMVLSDNLGEFSSHNRYKLSKFTSSPVVVSKAVFRNGERISKPEILNLQFVDITMKVNALSLVYELDTSVFLKRYSEAFFKKTFDVKASKKDTTKVIVLTDDNEHLVRGKVYDAERIGAGCFEVINSKGNLEYLYDDYDCTEVDLDDVETYIGDREVYMLQPKEMVPMKGDFVVVMKPDKKCLEVGLEEGFIAEIEEVTSYIKQGQEYLLSFTYRCKDHVMHNLYINYPEECRIIDTVEFEEEENDFKEQNIKGIDMAYTQELLNDIGYDLEEVIERITEAKAHRIPIDVLTRLSKVREELQGIETEVENLIESIGVA